MSNRITAAQLNAFVTPSIDVLEKLARISTRLGTLRRQQWSIPPETLVILIGISGGLNGTIAFQFDPPVLKQILNNMLGTPISPLTDYICWDVLGEISSMIVGNATGHLEALGLRVTITPPRVLTGEQASLLITQKEGIVIPLHSALGEIGLCVFFEND
jgi:chemotaxis protein CheX